MSATVADPPVGGRAATRGRLDSRSTPGRLRLLLALIVGLALVTGVIATVTAGRALTGTDQVVDETAPLLGNAEAIFTSIADADATAAQAFLSGGLEPTPLVLRYQADIARAAEQLAQAAGHAGEAGPAADAVRRLNVLLPQYTGLIQAARANNRQNNSVGIAYLLTAGELARGVPADPTTGTAAKDGLLIAAQDLFTAEQQRLDGDYASARATGWLVVTGLLTIALLGALGYVQAFLTRRMHRLVNLGLAGATVVVVAVAVLSLALVAVQHSQLSEAKRVGSDPLVAAANARIAVLTQRGAESLTLAAHQGSAGDSEQRFREQTALLLGTDDRPGLLSGTPAEALERQYLQTHDQVRSQDDGTDYRGAVTTALGPGGTAFAALDDELSRRVGAAQDTFSAAAAGARTGLLVLLFVIPLGAIAVCVLSVIGVRERLEEYR
jgi:hypothetical protein